MNKISEEDKAGLYITVAVHLTVIIVLLLCRIGTAVQSEKGFLLDFSREEAIERKAAEERRRSEEDAFDQAVSRRLDQLISGESGTAFRNISVNRGDASLKDDRGTDADDLYDDAERLAKALRDGIAEEEDDNYVSVKKDKGQNTGKDAHAYSGPSVISYSLAGRKASHLPIPAYKCYGGGMVTVIIEVNNSGRVTKARIQDATSSEDSCLRAFALKAAKMSRFSVDPKAPARQVGDIVYQFVAQ